MLDLHRRVQMTLEVTAEDMSQYLYLESRAGEEGVPCLLYTSVLRQ